eukprot:37940-Eustigmatos_ZCMA.PRE.1
MTQSVYIIFVRLVVSYMSVPLLLVLHPSPRYPSSHLSCYVDRHPLFDPSYAMLRTRMRGRAGARRHAEHGSGGMERLHCGPRR